jgi:hypothetical protein
MWEKACKKAGSDDYSMRKACYEKMTKGCKCDLAGKCDAPPLTPGEKPLIVDGAMLEHDVRVHGVQPSAAKSYMDVVQGAIAKAKAKVKSKALPPGVTDKKAWEKAEEIVRKQHGTTDGKWGLVRHIYDQMTGHTRREKAAKGYVAVAREVLAKAGAPYIGPKGGKWADPQHTIPWQERKGRTKTTPAERPSGFLGRVMQAADEHAGATRKVINALAAEYGSGYVKSPQGIKDIETALAHWRSFPENRAKARAAGVYSGKGFQLLARDAMAKAGAYVGAPQQGVPFTGPYSPLVPSSMAGDMDDKKYKGEKYSYGEGMGKAEWTTAYVNDLPDSAFLYVGAGGKKDPSGRTVPRSLRKFPVRGMDGKFDTPHVRNAISRAPQAKGMSAEEKARIQRKASDILKRIGGSEA